jgi:hypothetical protein
MLNGRTVNPLTAISRAASSSRTPCPSRVIHDIPAIPACPVRPKSGHSANDRVARHQRCNENDESSKKLIPEGKSY